MRAAAALGPKTAMPRWRSSSARPATSGASGPTTTRSIAELAGERRRARRGSSARTGWQCARAAMPGLPGAACSSSSGRCGREPRRARARALPTRRRAPSPADRTAIPRAKLRLRARRCGAQRAGERGRRRAARGKGLSCLVGRHAFYLSVRSRPCGPETGGARVGAAVSSAAPLLTSALHGHACAAAGRRPPFCRGRSGRPRRRREPSAEACRGALPLLRRRRTTGGASDDGRARRGASSPQRERKRDRALARAELGFADRGRRTSTGSGRAGRAGTPAMYDPGLDRHEWESEMQALEDDSPHRTRRRRCPSSTGSWRGCSRRAATS